MSIRNAAYFALLNRHKQESECASLLQELVSAHELEHPQEGYWEEAGYKYAGIIALGYLSWIRKKIDEAGVHRVYFLLPSGRTLCQVFHELYPEYDSRELSISKRMIDKEYGRRSIFLEYLKSNDFFDGKCAIVGLEWDQELIDGIARVRYEEKELFAMGFFLTAGIAPKSMEVNGFFVEANRVNPQILFPLDGYIMRVLEGMFALPTAVPTDIQKTSEGIQIIYCKNGEKKDCRIAQDVLHGIGTFLRDIRPQMKQLKLDIGVEQASWPLEYIATSSSAYDDRSMCCATCYIEHDVEEIAVPLARCTPFRFGIILPNNQSHAGMARKMALRLARTAEECGVVAILTDEQGRKLDPCFVSTGDPLGEIAFLISLDFRKPKLLDQYCYLSCWLLKEEILQEHGGYAAAVNACCTYDDYLPTLDHESELPLLQSVLLDCPRKIGQEPVLMASLPSKMSREPSFSRPMIFCCRNNKDWNCEKLHWEDELFLQLNNAGIVKDYEFSKNTGQADDENEPLLSAMNECGICLAFPNSRYWGYGTGYHRIFEICASGAVMIVDNRPLWRDIFGDSVLYVEYPIGKPTELFQKIMEHYQWVLEHREKALEMARAVQKIYQEKYTMNIFLKGILAHHATRVNNASANLFARNDSVPVLVAYICNTNDLATAKRLVGKVLTNIGNQFYRSLLPIFGVDQSIAREIEIFCSTLCASARICTLALFNVEGKRIMTDGQAILHLQKLEDYSYFMIANADEIWFSDHVTTLVRTLENNPQAMAAHAGQIFQDQNERRCLQSYEEMEDEALLESYANRRIQRIHYPYPGAFLFRKKCRDEMPDFLFDYLDGKEYLAYLHLLRFKKNADIKFTYRATFLYGTAFEDSRHSVMNEEEEQTFIFGLTSIGRKRQNSLRYVFPWHAVPFGGKIVLYGSGIVLNEFLCQITQSAYCHVVAICQEGVYAVRNEQVPFCTEDELAGWDPWSYDLILIAIEEKDKAAGTRRRLELAGIPSEKICWLKPVQG